MSSSGSELIVTGVDALIDLLKKEGQMDVASAAKRLKYSEETVQSWADFLVEENLIGIDYKLTKPVIYLITEKKNKDPYSELKEEFAKYKKDFDANLKKKELTSEKSAFEWKEHILGKLELLQSFFMSEAEKRGLKQPEKLWEEYKKKTISTD